MSVSFKKSEALENVTSGEFAPIAPGVYNVKFDDLKERPTQSGGVQWSAMLKIVDGAKFVGRTFWVNWNVVNANDKAQEIARREIAQIADLMGIGDDISIETMRTNKVFTIQLDVGDYLGKPDYKPKNWKLAGEAVGVAAPAKTFTTTVKAAPSTTAKAKPWDKK